MRTAPHEGGLYVTQHLDGLNPQHHFTAKHNPCLHGEHTTLTVITVGLIELLTNDPETLRELARCLLNAATENERLAGSTRDNEPHRAMGLDGGTT